MPKKCILILLDGLGDRSYSMLDNRTPLQAARTPALDSLAKEGINGLFHASALGQALPSETAHFIIWGYDMAAFPGRGILEALGAGIDMSANDVALLAHFVGVSEKNGILVLDQAKPAAHKDEIDELIKRIRQFRENDIDITFHPTGGIRGILKLCGNVSPFITDTDPIGNGKPLVAVLPWMEFQRDTASQKTATALTRYLSWVYRQLGPHSVNLSRQKSGKPLLNGIVTQRAGRMKEIDPFVEKYGMRGLIIASGLVYWGLGTYLGLDIEKVTDTRNPGGDLEDRLQLAYTRLTDYDFIHVHTKTPDEAAHTKDPLVKKEVIESLDAGIGRVLKMITDDPDVLLIVTADHSTPSAGPLIHSGESVPLLIHGDGIRQDAIQTFDEVAAAQGALGGVRGRELMFLILNHLERSKLAGLMDTPADQPYWPGNYEPFRLV